MQQFGADGYAIGGLAVGEPAPVMYEMIEIVNGILPQDKPRYLMGVGTPVNILEAIDRGVDMFDCVMPTRNGRNGQLFTAEGVINIRNKKWEADFSPIDPEGTAFVDRLYSKAYLHHLAACGEMLAAEIASLHNIAFLPEAGHDGPRAHRRGRLHPLETADGRPAPAPTVGRRDEGGEPQTNKKQRPRTAGPKTRKER